MRDLSFLKERLRNKGLQLLDDGQQALVRFQDFFKKRVLDRYYPKNEEIYSKTIYLVRHAQYERIESSMGRTDVLTDLGFRQSQFLAQYLSRFPITRIYHSTFDRAQLSAQILQKLLSDVELIPDQSLVERTPGFPKGFISKYGLGQFRSLLRHRIDAEKSYRKHFRYFESEDQHHVIVSHGNLIRFFICKVLKIPSRYWQTLEMKQCALTVIVLRSDGTCRLLTHNELGHLPIDIQTNI